MSRPVFRVLRGRPSDREAAALALALERLEEPEHPAPGRPAWLRAARVEGRGGSPVAAPGDLRATRR